MSQFFFTSSLFLLGFRVKCMHGWWVSETCRHAKCYKALVVHFSFARSSSLVIAWVASLSWFVFILFTSRVALLDCLFGIHCCRGCCIGKRCSGYVVICLHLPCLGKPSAITHMESITIKQHMYNRCCRPPGRDPQFCDGIPHSQSCNPPPPNARRLRPKPCHGRPHSVRASCVSSAACWGGAYGVGRVDSWPNREIVHSTRTRASQHVDYDPHDDEMIDEVVDLLPDNSDPRARGTQRIRTLWPAWVGG